MTRTDPSSEDTGCSEAGNWFSGYGMGQCPIRGEPCVAACLRRTIADMKLSIDSHPLQNEVRYQSGRNDGIDEAVALCKKVGSRSVAGAIRRLRTTSPGAAASKVLVKIGSVPRENE